MKIAVYSQESTKRYVETSVNMYMSPTSKATEVRMSTDGTSPV